MWYPVCGMVHIKEPLLLIEKSGPYSGSIMLPLSLSKWSFTICAALCNPRLLALSGSKAGRVRSGQSV